MNYKEARLKLIQLMGGKCNRCGEADIAKLEIHHTKRIVTAKGDRNVELRLFIRIQAKYRMVWMFCAKSATTKGD